MTFDFEKYWDSIPLLSDENMLRLMRLTSGEYNYLIMWVKDHNGRIRFSATCSDVFAWGTSDAENITDENIDVLEECINECESALGRGEAYDAFLLFSARVRGMRPQGAYYEHIDAGLRHLFDDCGPERDIDLLNPKSQPATKNTMSPATP